EVARVLNSSGDGDGDIDLRITTPAGDARVISQRTSVERDVAGNVVGVHGSYQDITRRVATERALRESEAGYRGLFAANPHPMWVYDIETLAFLEVNDAAVAHYGYRRDEFEAMSIEDIRPSEDVPRLLANISTAGNQTIDTAGTWKHRTKDGAIIDVEITSHVLDYGGRRAELVLAHDITERMRIEEALKKSEAALKEAQRDAQVGHWEWSALTGATTWSDEVYRILGIPIGSATPSYELLFGIIDLKGRHRIEKEIARAIGSSSDLDGVVDMDLPITTPAGTALVVSHRAFVDRDAAGNVVGFHGTCQDITRRMEMEHALRDSEASLAEAQQIAHVGSAIVYVKSGEIHASDEYFRIFDLEPRPGTPINVFLERIHEEDRGAVKAALNAAVSSGAFDVEFRIVCGDGSIRFAHGIARKRVGDERIFGLLGTIEDVTERKLAEEALRQHGETLERSYIELEQQILARRESEEAHRRLSTVVEQASEAIIVTDTSGVIEYVNPAFERITGYTHDEVVGRPARILKSGKQDAAFYKNLWSTITAGSVWHGHFVSKRKDGSLYEEDATISPVRDNDGTITNFVAMKRDVTAEVALEEQLRHAQKIEALGTLAGGVAHDFNNLVQAMLSSVQLVKRTSAELPRQVEHPTQL
ncbi:MAG: PAS domain S-box protein, partial [Thermoanaerobaculia bacterium]